MNPSKLISPQVQIGLLDLTCPKARLLLWADANGKATHHFLIENCLVSHLLALDGARQILTTIHSSPKQKDNKHWPWSVTP